MLRARHSHPRRQRIAGLLAVVALLVLAAGCGNDDDGGDGAGTSGSSDGATTTDEPVAPQESTTSAGPVDPASLTPTELAEHICAADGEGYEDGQVVGQVQNPTLFETSGVVASALNPGVLWAHNDSSGEPVVYALGTDGSDLGEWQITGADARDWEEMAAGYDPEADEHHLFLADIGDNQSRRESVTVYRVTEPVVDGSGGATETAARYRLEYPDGAHDAETFIVDPATGDWYVLTKGWGTGISQVFRASDPAIGSTTTLEDLGFTVNLKDLGSYATAGDANGVVVVRTYDEVVVWPLEGPVGDALAGSPCTGPSADEPQGEAIALAPDRTGYYTISEGAHAPIHWFPFTP